MAALSYFLGSKKSKTRGSRRSAPYAKKGRATTVQSNAALIRSLNKRIGGFVGLEMKFFDSSRLRRAITSVVNMVGGRQDPDTVECLNAMVQDDSESGRIGRHIMMHSISVKGNFYRTLLSSTTVFPVSMATIYLVLDKQTNGAFMESQDLLVNESAEIELISQPFRNMEHTDRFQILAMRKVKIGQFYATTQTADVQAQSNQVEPFNLTYRWKKGKKVLFSGTTGTVANIEDNSLHCICFVDNINTPSRVEISYNARLRYTSS